MIIAEDVVAEALTLLVVKQVARYVECVRGKGPGFGDRRKAMLGDIANLNRWQVHQ